MEIARDDALATATLTFPPSLPLTDLLLHEGSASGCRPVLAATRCRHPRVKTPQAGARLRRDGDAAAAVAAAGTWHRSRAPHSNTGRWRRTLRQRTGAQALWSDLQAEAWRHASFIIQRAWSAPPLVLAPNSPPPIRTGHSRTAKPATGERPGQSDPSGRSGREGLVDGPATALP